MQALEPIKEVMEEVMIEEEENHTFATPRDIV